jgi:hypothetical protein
MSTRRALWVSTSMETRGGVATYVRTMLRTPLWDMWQTHHVATHGKRFRRNSRDRFPDRNRVARPRAGRPTTDCGSPAHGLLWQFCPQVHPCLDLALCWRSCGDGCTRCRVQGVLLSFNASPPALYSRDAGGSGRSYRVGETWARALRQIVPGARIAVLSQSQLADGSFPGGADLVMAWGRGIGPGSEQGGGARHRRSSPGDGLGGADTGRAPVEWCTRPYTPLDLPARRRPLQRTGWAA